MFGRKGWICDDCNNFNYETRNKCNRCGIPRKPKLLSNISNLNELKLTCSNIDHRNDWCCFNCKNINYPFRTVCNKCKMKKEDSVKAFENNEKIKNLGNINPIMESNNQIQ